MLPFIKCTCKATRSEITLIPVMSGRKQSFFFDLKVAQIANSRQGRHAFTSAPDIEGWLPPSFTTYKT